MSIRIEIDWEERCLKLKETNKGGKHRLPLQVNLNGVIFKGVDMAFILPNDRTAQVTANPVDAKGFPAEVENLVYTSSNESVATIDANGIITPLTLGDVQISATADADLGDGIINITGLLDVTVVAGTAVSMGLGAVML